MEINVEKIRNMNYTDFVSFLKEENRPSGGKKTIREIAMNGFVDRHSKVLEIGCTNGFSSASRSKEGTATRTVSL